MSLIYVIGVTRLSTQTPASPQKSPKSPQKSPISPQKSLMSPQKSPMSPQNSRMSPQKSHISNGSRHTHHTCDSYIKCQEWQRALKKGDISHIAPVSFLSQCALQIQRSPEFTLKRALYLLSKEPWIYLQTSPVFTLKRALYLLSKEPWIYSQKSPVFTLKRALYTLLKEPCTLYKEPYILSALQQTTELFGRDVARFFGDVVPTCMTLHIRYMCDVMCVTYPLHVWRYVTHITSHM